VIELRAGPAWVVDGGRAGRRWRGEGPGGALVIRKLAAANLSIGNPWAARAVEAHAGAVARAVEATRVGINGRAVDLEPGDSVSFQGYLAMPGGVTRRIGPIAAGETVDGARATAERTGRLAFRAQPRVRVVPGPDPTRLGADALARLCTTTWRVALANRTGFRLEGATLPRRGDDGGLSCPMVLGAIQVPASGQPIVLGPDGPVTGGYPIVAVVASVDLDALFARRPGDGVEFRCVSIAEAVTAARRARPLWLRRP
jgi:allophanate hydrolase subunit 2